MKRFLGKIVNLMKEENLFASQGGPIILAQVIGLYMILQNFVLFCEFPSDRMLILLLL